MTESSPPPSASHSGRAIGGLMLVAAALAGLVGGLLVWGLWALTHRSTDTAPVAGCDVPAVARDVLPSVVTLSVSGAAGAGTGSGVVVRTPIEGAGSPATVPPGKDYIITNDHVIAPGGDPGQVTVTFADGHVSAATVVGHDPLTDLAVVQAKDPSTHAKPVAIGDTATLVVGQPVVALGAPLGLSSTVTAGIVSAQDRYVRVPSASGATHHLVGAVQTDASINPGNSGGALVDCSGRLVGINSAGATPEGDGGSVGLGFAIPSGLFAPLGSEMIATGTVRHPTLGLQVVGVTQQMATQFGLPAGLYVQAVSSPASSAGLRQGDVLTALGGRPVREPDDLVQAELKATVGSTVEVTFARDGRSATTKITVAQAT